MFCFRARRSHFLSNKITTKQDKRAKLALTVLLARLTTHFRTNSKLLFLSLIQTRIQTKLTQLKKQLRSMPRKRLVAPN